MGSNNVSQLLNGLTSAWLTWITHPTERISLDIMMRQVTPVLVRI